MKDPANKGADHLREYDLRENAGFSAPLLGSDFLIVYLLQFFFYIKSSRLASFIL